MHEMWELKKLLGRAYEQLLWCSGAADFNEGGIARDGWKLGPGPLLLELAEVLRMGGGWTAEERDRLVLDRVAALFGCHRTEVSEHAAKLVRAPALARAVEQADLICLAEKQAKEIKALQVVVEDLDKRLHAFATRGTGR